MVIPARNAAHYVLDAIRSVWDQTERPLECIVVDDGSTDDTSQCASEAGQTRVIQTRRGGVSRARNLGAHHATGRYLAFLDADDIWKPEKLESQMALMRGREQLGLVYCGLEYVDENLITQGVYEAPDPDRGFLNSVLLRPPSVGLAQTGLMPRSVFNELSGFDEALSMCADLDLFLRVAARYPIAAIKAPLVKYRQHSEQMSVRQVDAMQGDIRRIAGKFRNELALFFPFRKRMLSRMNLLMGMSSWKNQKRANALLFLLRSLAWSPGEVASEVRRRMLPNGVRR